METLYFSEIAILSVACIIAYFPKGFSGFGPAPVFIPTVAVLWSPSLALTSSAFIDLFVGLFLILSLNFYKNDLSKILKMSFFVGIGTFIGAGFVGIISENLLRLIIGFFVFLFGLSFLSPAKFDLKIPKKYTSKFLFIGCILGGFTGGLVGISGPFIVVACRPLMDKSEFRRILVAVFWIEGILKIIAYSTVGVWDADVYKLAAIATPAILAGLFIGFKSHFRVNEKSFSLIVGIILLIIAINTIISTLR